MTEGLDPGSVGSHEELVHQLAALKSASGRTDQQVASEGRISLSAVQDLLKMARFPQQNTVEGFVRGCGVTQIRPWVSAWQRVKDQQPKEPRAPSATRAELAELADQHEQLAATVSQVLSRLTALTETVTTLQQEVRNLSQRAAAPPPPSLPKTFPRTFREAEEQSRRGTRDDGWETQPVRPRAYCTTPVNNLTSRLDTLIQEQRIEELEFLLTHLPPLKEVRWQAEQERFGDSFSRSRTWRTHGSWSGDPGYLAEDVDAYLTNVLARVRAVSRPDTGTGGQPQPT